MVREAGWFENAAIAWMVALMVLGCAWILRLEGLQWLLGIAILLVGVLSVVFSRLEEVPRREPADPGTSLAERRVPLLIVRCPGDEATNALSFVAILARILSTWNTCSPGRSGC